MFVSSVNSRIDTCASSHTAKRNHVCSIQFELNYRVFCLFVCVCVCVVVEGPSWIDALTYIHIRDFPVRRSRV